MIWPAAISPMRAAGSPAVSPRSTVALVAAMLACAPVATRADPLDDAVASLAEGVPYADARHALTAAGWSPRDFDTAAIEDRCSSRREICTAYPETESCSGTGVGYCLFRFGTTDDRSLSVVTAGEKLDELVIVRWMRE